MQAVFHVSSAASLAIAGGKVMNLLHDGTVSIDAVSIVIDDGRTIERLVSDTSVNTELEKLPDLVETTVCSNALAGSSEDNEDLPQFVTVVSSGVGELTRLQAEGYAYIRLLG